VTTKYDWPSRIASITARPGSSTAHAGLRAADAADLLNSATHCVLMQYLQPVGELQLRLSSRTVEPA